mmetsp:Transcript_110250/g.343731  ORF Transcript_110250/g.343731 Transcript_110250/m.343731 type:complete len:338 (-) Transcript_110250:30-1043(-)
MAYKARLPAEFATDALASAGAARGRREALVLEALLAPSAGMTLPSREACAKVCADVEGAEQSCDGSTTLGDDASSEPSVEDHDGAGRGELRPLDCGGAQLLSQGSSLHSIGACEPCAWFWKPQGCMHGWECKRCHLCPDGEIKLRKKAKHSKMQAQQRSGAAAGRGGRGTALTSGGPPQTQPAATQAAAPVAALQPQLSDGVPWNSECQQRERTQDARLRRCPATPRPLAAWPQPLPVGRQPLASPQPLEPPQQMMPMKVHTTLAEVHYMEPLSEHLAGCPPVPPPGLGMPVCLRSLRAEDSQGAMRGHRAIGCSFTVRQEQQVARTMSTLLVGGRC